jgi:glycosyltransferase involved in cell wall biosynthesis
MSLAPCGPSWGGPTTPEVSAIVPTHDRSSLLPTTLTTVLWQRDVDLEVVVVDDGSTEDVSAIVDRFQDNRIRLVRNDAAQGVSAARSRGVEKARGRWVAFVDDDDLWAPNKLRAQLAAVSAVNAEWAYCGSVSVDLELNIVGGQPPPSPHDVASKIARYNLVPGGGSAVLASREVMCEVGPFDRRLYNTEDWEMWIRLSKVGVPACASGPLMGYRLHSANASLDVAAILEGIFLIERRHETRVDMGVIHRWVAESCLRRGLRGGALVHLAKAAVRGQAANVAGDVMSILRRRLNRHLRKGEAGVEYRHPDYIDAARSWVEELKSFERHRSSM